MSDRHEHSIQHMPISGTGQAFCDCGASVRVVMFKPTEPWHGCPLCCINYDGAMPGVPVDEMPKATICPLFKLDEELYR